MSLTVGIDIGGSSVNAVARNDDAEIVARYDHKAIIDGTKQVTTSALAAINGLGIHGFSGVGVGIPGQVDPISGHVSLAVNLGIGTEPFDLAKRLRSEIGTPVTLENDVRAAALGAFESLSMLGEVDQSITVLSIGTGISAGVVINRALVRGARGMAGEIGHVVVEEAGPVCRCGQRGCLEAVAAGPAIGRAWPKGRQDLAATALFTAASDGDAAARKVASRVTGYLATALIWMAATYDTDMTVLTGGVATSSPGFLEMIRGHIEASAAHSEIAARRLDPERIRVADALDPPGPRGAALLAANEIHQQRDLPAPKQASNDQ